MDEQFARDHAPGSMVVTASAWPTLILEPDERPGWLPSPLAYALHLLGTAPLPPPGDEVRRGKHLEPVAINLLREAGHPELTKQVRLEHRRIPALAYPDALTVDGTIGYEIKVVDARDYERDWTPAPLYPRLQAQAQAACGGHRLTLIVPVVVGYKTIELGQIVEEPRRDDVIDVLERAATEFLSNLHAGKLPAADTSMSSYRALQAITTLTDEQIRLDDREAVEKLARWRELTAQVAAGDAATKEITGLKAWFSARAGDAGRIAVGTTILRRKHVDVAEHNVKASAYWRWSMRHG